MKLTVLLIHYHTPDLLQRSVEALVADAEESSFEVELVVVDNGSDPRDRAMLEALPVRLLAPTENLGYAGGINLGMEKTDGEYVVVMNPDVFVLSGCLAALVEALEDGAAVVGPRFFWDEAKLFLLPPIEPVGRGWELLNVLAERGGMFTRRARTLWRRHARRHWLAERPLSSFSLSGALLALRRDVWARVGPFDNGYQLYFEETDWLERVRRAGLRALYLPAAGAVHIYAQSTVREGRSADWFLASSRRFRRRTYGIFFTWLLEFLAPRKPLAIQGSAPVKKSLPLAWLEVASSPKGYPAAGWRLEGVGDGTPAVPAEVWGRMAPGDYWLRGLDGEGLELWMECLEKDQDGP
jgi:GT2 family glycosyltransferase